MAVISFSDSLPLEDENFGDGLAPVAEDLTVVENVTIRASKSLSSK